MKKKTTDSNIPVSITGRKLAVTPALRDYAMKKVNRLQKYFDRLMEVHIIVSTEKHQQIAEINLSANGVTLSGKGKTSDIFASIDTVIDKLERQLKKRQEKWRERKRMASKMKQAQKAIVPSLIEDYEKSMDLEPSIVKIEKLSQKPMSVDEAAMQLDVSDLTFLPFINSSTDELNVLYRRSDGNYTLITRK